MSEDEHGGFSRRSFLQLAIAAAVGPYFLGRNAIARYVRESATDSAISDAVPLCTQASRLGLLYGCAQSKEVLSRYPDVARKTVQQCKIIVPESELKWSALRPSPNTFRFEAADWIADFARHNDLRLRGHTLVWHKSNPSWLTNVRDYRSTLTEHIRTVVGHYRGRVQSWDVVNEVVFPADKVPDGLRRSIWFEKLGPDYIDLAFRTAAAADPAAMLVYNEMFLEYDTPYCDANRKSVLKVIDRLLSGGTPIHALGIQSHLRARDRFNPGVFQDFLAQVADRGLKILLTELDVRDHACPADVAERDREVAQATYEYLSTSLSQHATIAVLTWGLSDRFSFMAKASPRSDGLPVRPLPYDAELQPKPMWSAMARAFANASHR